MNRPPLLIERAFELAREGASLERIRKQLNAEHYFDVDPHLRSPTLKHQLRAAGAKRQQKPPAGGEHH